jgi:PhoH-like ATPase
MKYFVFDTNVLLYDAESVFKFKGDDVTIVIPITVIEEIDKFKKELSDRGRNARQFSRNIEKLRKKGDITKGIRLDNGSTVLIQIPKKQISDFCEYCFMGDEADNRILTTALCIKEHEADPSKVIFLTKDINLRIKADALGITARDYIEKDISKFEEHNYGWKEIVVSEQVIVELYKNRKIPVEKTGIKEPLFVNQFFLLKNETNNSNSALAFFHSEMDELELIDPKFKEKSFWGIKPRNKEQIFALKLLLDNSIKLVSLVGKAGTGKTLLAIAAGLNQVIDENLYKKLVVSRPIFPMGKDLGFLPGDVESKLSPWMRPVFDNLDFLLHSGEQEYDYKFLMDKKLLELEPLTYIRGRSISEQYLIVDEAQNLTPHEIKTIITRAGENTKIVLTGDPYQIDTPYLDSTNNGLIYTVEKFKNQSIAGTVTLTKGERSPLAELASNLL